MIETFLRKLRHVSRNIWVRVLLVSLLSLVATFGAKLFGRFIPTGLNEAIGANALNRLLDILANSMLMVTTFSLTVMVSIHTYVSSQWTPRAQRIHMSDTRTQIVLATFLGAYIYALNGIILLESYYFDEQGIVVLYLMTLAVIGAVVLMLIRWILHLQSIGSLPDTAHRIEREAVTAMQARMAEPSLGANPLTEETVMPLDAFHVPVPRTGFLVYIYEQVLQNAAQADDVMVYVLPRIGDVLQKGDPLVAMSRPSAKVRAALEQAIVIGEMRSSEQDPAFGVQMLAEIGSKALSPGINDPGTANDMIVRVARVIDSWDGVRNTPGAPLDCPNLYIRPLDPGRILTAGLEPIARDGASDLWVMRMLIATAERFARHPDPDLAKAGREIAARARMRAEAAIPFAVDAARLDSPAP